MPVSFITVEFEKRANDGDYGSELCKVSWQYELDAGEDPSIVTAALQGQIRGRVESDLANSANLKVRRSLIRQQRTCSRCGEELADGDNGYLHKACDEAEKAEREERYQQRRRETLEAQSLREATSEDLVAAGVDDDDEPGPF